MKKKKLKSKNFEKLTFDQNSNYRELAFYVQKLNFSEPHMTEFEFLKRAKNVQN